VRGGGGKTHQGLRPRGRRQHDGARCDRRRTPGLHEDFYPNAAPTAGEKKKHVRVSVYEGAWSAEADYDKQQPALTGEVELGEQLTKQASPANAAGWPFP
jgi:hypothetical protein